MSDFASNLVFTAPLLPQSAEYEGEPTKVAMTEAQRANGFLPEGPVAAEHLNWELNALTATDETHTTNIAANAALIASLQAQAEAHALCNFTTETSGTAEHLLSVIWDTKNSQFVAVGENGVILTSPGGKVWTSRTSGLAPQGISAVAGNASILVAVAGNGAIITSPDGITWTSRTSGVATLLSDVVWSAALGLFLTTGASSVLLTSPDGITWTSRTVGGSSTTYVAIAASSSMVVIGAGSGAMRSSPDGITWSSRSSGIGSILAITWTGTVFIAVGAGGSLSTSSNGTSWNAGTSGTTGQLDAVVFAAQNALAVGTDVSIVSRDIATWYDAHGRATYTLRGAAWNGRVAVLVGNSGKILNSLRVALV